MYFKITRSNIIGVAQSPYDNIQIKTNKLITNYIHGLGIN